MTILKVDLESNQFREIGNYSVAVGSWMVVTRLGGELRFKGYPYFAINADAADYPVVDVKRGIIILPPLTPIPANVLYPR